MPTYYLGTDEAGYGPNLGPLVIAGSLWRLNEPTSGEIPEFDWYERFSHGITDSQRDSVRRIVIADSKKLYASGDSLRALEWGICCALASLGRAFTNTNELHSALHCALPNDLPWMPQEPRALPSEVNASDWSQGNTLWKETCEQANVSLVDYRAVMLHPPLFNQRCAAQGNKSTVLSCTTLQLIRDLLPSCNDGPVLILCDKHGGRAHYANLLLNELLATDGALTSGCELTTLTEGRAVSAYRWREHGFTREIRFLAKGERFLPAALASMAAKYLRELAMHDWNAFWQQHLPSLAPTAGYPVDAQRFRKAIEPLTREWNWPETLWWRLR